jgi:hypothetical protein
MLRAAAAVVGALCLAGCAAGSKPPQDPFQLEANRLTVDNQTSDRWSDVEIWLNNYYRVTVPFIAAGGRFQVPLNSFVAGYGQRFDFKRAQITDLKLTAKRSDGTPFELKKQFEVGGLAGALKGMGGRR